MNLYFIGFYYMFENAIEQKLNTHAYAFCSNIGVYIREVSPKSVIKSINQKWWRYHVKYVNIFYVK